MSIAYARRVFSAAPRRRRSASNSVIASRHAGVGSGGLSSASVGLFFIDTSTGHVATQRQLLGAGILVGDEAPPRPWLRIQGSSDASTMWYAVMRRQERGVYIGALVLRHGDHHTLLRERGWEDVPIEEIGSTVGAGGPPTGG